MTDDEIRRIDAWWRAANYLSVGQIYLLDNPLLREPLRLEHVKPRLLGHWGTTPGLNLVYVHMNRAILERDLDAIYVIGPGHGGPAIVANAWLEGTYCEVYPEVIARRGRDARGCSASSRSPAASRATSRPRRPARSTRAASSATRSSHAYGAAFDNPDLVVCCVVGDGEAETGPLADELALEQVPRPRRPTARCCRSCTSTATRSPTRRCSRASPRRADRPARGLRLPADLRRGRRPDAGAPAHRRGASTRRSTTIDRDPADARARTAPPARPAWPMIVLRTPKGWTGPPRGRRAAGRGHVPRPPGAAGRPARPTRSTSRSSSSGCARTGPRSCSTSDGPPVAELAALPPRGRPADERQPARQRRRAAARPAAARLPRLRRRRAARRAAATAEATRVLGGWLRDVIAANAAHATSASSAPTRPRRTGCSASSRSTDRRLGRRVLEPATTTSPRDGRVMEMLSRAPVPGLARGLPAHRPARAVHLLRGLHPHRRLDVQPARQVAEGDARHPLAPADRLAQLPADVATSGARTTTASPTRTRASSTTCVNKKAEVVRVYLPPDANTLLSIVRPLPAQPATTSTSSSPASSRRRSWLTMDEAIAALHPRHRHLGVGQHRRAARAAGRRAGLRRRRPDARDARRRRAAAPSTCPTCGCAWSTSSTSCACSRESEHPHGHARPRVRRALHRPTGR